jgi:hypothetical protein
VLVDVGRDRGHSGDTEVEGRDRPTETFDEGQHESADAAIDVQRQPVFERDRGEFTDGIHDPGSAGLM